MKAYLANGLFVESDFLYNELLASQIRNAVPGIDLYVPQENGSINDKSQFADSQMIFRADASFLDSVDVVIAVLDHMDDGMLVEIGMASRMGKVIVGLSTDIRHIGTDNDDKVKALIDDPLENQFIYLNLMAVGAIKDSKNGRILQSRKDLVAYLKELSENYG